MAFDPLRDRKMNWVEATWLTRLWRLKIPSCPSWWPVWTNGELHVHRPRNHGSTFSWTPAITAGQMRNRHDVVLTGQVIAEQPIAAVSLIVGGEVRALSLYGRTAGSQQVFRLNLAQRTDLASASTSFEVAARTKDGHEHRTAFKIVTDQNDPRSCARDRWASVQASVACGVPSFLFCSTLSGRELTGTECCMSAAGLPR